MIIYLFLKRNRAVINSILIAIFSSLFFNTLSDVHSDKSHLLEEILNLNSLAGWLTIISLILLIIVNATIWIVSMVLNHHMTNETFRKIMLENTSETIRDSVTPGIFSWGDDKTVELCEEIIFGWHPRAIKVEGYINEYYDFPNYEKDGVPAHKYLFNREDYEKYIQSESFQKEEKEGNNLPRFMLRGCKPNFNKHDGKLLLYTQRTNWSYCRYVWNTMKEKGVLLDYAKGIASGLNSEDFLPNSLCLHGIIETSDDKIILAKISQTKFNDKPQTWAVTFGEQIEAEDYTDGNVFKKDFILNTVTRAFHEEYKMEFNQVGSESGIRVLSIDYEGDIYNFSIVTCIRLNCKAKSFIEEQNQKLVTAEATELKAISYKEIPEILINYHTNKHEYHPSSYLRLMIMYMHRYGIDKLQREIIKLHKEQKK